jgi:hypothetical protein
MRSSPSRAAYSRMPVDISSTCGRIASRCSLESDRRRRNTAPAPRTSSRSSFESPMFEADASSSSCFGSRRSSRMSASNSSKSALRIAAGAARWSSMQSTMRHKRYAVPTLSRRSRGRSEIESANVRETPGRSASQKRRSRSTETLGSKLMQSSARSRPRRYAGERCDARVVRGAVEWARGRGSPPPRSSL